MGQVTNTSVYPGGTGNSPTSLYVYTDRPWPTGICGVPNLAGSDAAVQSTINSQATNTAFNATGLSDSPPPASVTQSPVVLPTATNAVRAVNVSGAFGTVKNPA